MNPRERATVGCRKCGSIYFAEPALCADCLAEDRAAALEQTRRETVEEMRSYTHHHDFCGYTFDQQTQMGELGPECTCGLNVLLSAPKAGDKYREVREAFVAGVKWRHGKVRGWPLVQEHAEHETLRRWPLSELTGAVYDATLRAEKGGRELAEAEVKRLRKIIAESLIKRVELIDAASAREQGAYRTAEEHLNRAEAAEATAERERERAEELDRLFALQQTRMGKATELWREATGRHDVLPDLGDLLDWLMSRIEALERADALLAPAPGAEGEQAEAESLSIDARPSAKAKDTNHD